MLGLPSLATVEPPVIFQGQAEKLGMRPGSLLAPFQIDGVVGVIEAVDIARQRDDGKLMGVGKVPHSGMLL